MDSLYDCITCIKTKVRAPSEVKDFIWYSLTILLTSGTGVALASVKAGLISQYYGIPALNIYTMVASLISNFSSMIGFYGFGLSSVISRDIAKDDTSQIGKRINSNFPLNIFFSGLFVLLLYFLRDPLLELYLIPESDKPFTRYFYDIYLSIVPIIVFGLINGYTMLGFHALFLKMIMDVSANSLEVVAFLLFSYYSLGVESVIYTSQVRWIIMLLQIAWIYQPLHINRYQLFTRQMWNFKSSQFRSVLVVESSYLIMRGILMMAQYMVIPFVASHLGTYQYAAYSIMNALFYYGDMVGDSIGAACVLKGSQYYGLKKHSLYRQMLKVVSLVGIGLSILFFIILLFGKDLIFRLFTSENRVHVEIAEAYPYYLFVIFLAPIVGILEGFLFARQNFLELFVIMLVGAIMWASIIAINMVLFRNLSLIWVAHSLLFWTRFFGSTVIIACDTYREWRWDDGYPEEENTDTEIKEIKEIKEEGEKAPLIYY